MEPYQLECGECGEILAYGDSPSGLKGLGCCSKCHDIEVMEQVKKGEDPDVAADKAKVKCQAQTVVRARTL